MTTETITVETTEPSDPAPTIDINEMVEAVAESIADELIEKEREATQWQTMTTELAAIRSEITALAQTMMANLTRDEAAMMELKSTILEALPQKGEADLPAEETAEIVQALTEDLPPEPEKVPEKTKLKRY